MENIEVALFFLPETPTYLLPWIRNIRFFTFPLEKWLPRKSSLSTTHCCQERSQVTSVSRSCKFLSCEGTPASKQLHSTPAPALNEAAQMLRVSRQRLSQEALAPTYWNLTKLCEVEATGAQPCYAGLWMLNPMNFFKLSFPTNSHSRETQFPVQLFRGPFFFCARFVRSYPALDRNAVCASCASAVKWDSSRTLRSNSSSAKHWQYLSTKAWDRNKSQRNPWVPQRKICEKWKKLAKISMQELVVSACNALTLLFRTLTFRSWSLRFDKELPRLFWCARVWWTFCIQNVNPQMWGSAFRRYHSRYELRVKKASQNKSWYWIGLLNNEKDKWWNQKIFIFTRDFNRLNFKVRNHCRGSNLGKTGGSNLGGKQTKQWNSCQLDFSETE